MVPVDEKPSAVVEKPSGSHDGAHSHNRQYLASATNSNSAIMASIDTPSLSIFQKNHILNCLEDISLDESEDERNNLPDVAYPSLNSLGSEHIKSFLLIDGNEHLKVHTTDQFTSKLHCDKTANIKVVSIFGNTGDGKSHTLNHAFFGGQEVFPESAQQDSCTLGVRAAYAAAEHVITLDTEGLLGATARENQRTRLLLKILAISDLVLYRTRAERLHKDLFSFLGGASKAYVKHFSDALSRVGKEASSTSNSSQCQEATVPCSLGPAVLIFHETRHTQPLQPCAGDNSPEEQLRKRFSQLGLDLQAFSSLRYVGQQNDGQPTDFSTVKAAIHAELSNTAVRSARPPKLVLDALRSLNEKFSGQLQDNNLNLFPPEYFSCSAICASCGERCEHSMGHLRDNTEHKCSRLCTFQHQFQNCEYLCTACYNNGQRQIVVPKMAAANEQSSWLGIAKYAWSGYVLECCRCGVIYRSRQFWYGNKDPDQSVVRAEVCHVWESSCVITTGHNTARRVLDGVTQISEAVANVGAVPSRAFSSWVADQIAPKYWIPNRDIYDCFSCKTSFASDESKHHCRACGRGFCEPCSAFSRPVPERGWGQSPVRVCKNCLNPASSSVIINSSIEESAGEEVRVRKYGEAVIGTLSSVASVVLEYPKGLIKDSVRPDYWVPDADIHQCCVCHCNLPTTKQRAHHCRDCGQGVCHSCSSQRRPVPRRGWDTPVRVCDTCLKRL